MAVAMIPPCGSINDAQKRRYLRQREETSPDPVERYKLREARINDELTSACRDLVNNAKKQKSII